MEFGGEHYLNDDLLWTTSDIWIAKTEFEHGDFDTAHPMATTTGWNVATRLAWQASDRLNLSGQVIYVGKRAGHVVEDDMDLGPGKQPSVPDGQNSDPCYMVDVAACCDLTDGTLFHASVGNLSDDQPKAEVDYREDGCLFKIGLATRF
ncbi:MULTISPECIES: hypothetical protein [unclassified Paracoccus (in: a-proteobacteria)]|uniref:hypothetical protein n=1 Tax=unclassified Paracoccus (in: a-proteobacteria) TaxID=2688777 RepID=UPI0016009831|nr:MULTISPECIES: hypothetical protein [unclassified Paracoccus (in: a-proteobacteria)]MBB1491835.1 hypothetical protein [Paracoccus sp. MC1854]MBB1496931.1 hypothetical protein [Paracoccus sp. MC1862]QQO45552.1 hypothetical protein JGR78_04165 [Paracoccus sp. MC1862]